MPATQYGAPDARASSRIHLKRTEMTLSFEELITDVCALIRFGEPKRLIAGEPLYLNDVMFSIVPEEHIAPGRIFLFASFGDLPRANEIKVLEELLKENHAGFSGEGPGFTISPTTGKVVYSLHVFLSKTNAEELAYRMVYLAQKAREWRDTYFLDRPAAIVAS